MSRRGQAALTALLAGCAAACAATGQPETSRRDPGVPAPSLPPADAPASGARALHRLVPEDAETLLYLDHGRLGRPAWLIPPELAEQHRAERGFAEDAEVERELQAALPAPTADEAVNLTVFAGRFDRQALRAAALGRAGARSYRDVTIWGAEQTLALGLSGLALLGPRATVQAALDVEATRARAVTSAPWYLEAERALAGLWPDRLAPALELRTRVTAALRARLSDDEGPIGELDWIAARVALERGLAVRVVGQAGSERRARAVAGWARAFFLDLADTPTVAQLGLAPLLRQARVGQGGRDCGAVADAAPVVCWRLDLTEGERDLLMQRIERVLEAARGAARP